MDSLRAADAQFTQQQIRNLENGMAATEPPPAPPGASTGSSALKALGMILSGMGQGLSSAARGEPGPRYLPRESGGCSSDYSCGVGFSCVKAYGSSGRVLRQERRLQRCSAIRAARPQLGRTERAVD